MKTIIAMLEEVANSVEAKGLIKEAEELDIIANTIEAGLFSKLVGTSAILLSMFSGAVAGQPGENNVKNMFQTLLVDLQEAKSPDIAEIAKNDAGKFIVQKVKDTKLRNQMVEKLDDTFKDTLKKIPKGQTALA